MVNDIQLIESKDNIMETPTTTPPLSLYNLIYLIQHGDWRDWPHTWIGKKLRLWLTLLTNKILKVNSFDSGLRPLTSKASKESKGEWADETIVYF